MIARRRLAFGVVTAAAALLAGRALSVLYDSYTWYDSLGARAVWAERFLDTALIDGLGCLIAMAFVLANLAFARRSVGALARPARLANVEFGEAVPPSQILFAAIVIAAAIAIALLRFLPSWHSLALARLGVDFREADPYFQHDLSFYVSWLPLERALYSWTLALVASVTAIVVGLYVLASGIRWNPGALYVSPPARRHLALLAALLLLICTWSYRLDSYELLTNGGHDGSGFSFFDHRWMLPALVALSLATVALALTVAVTAWMGQLRTSLIAIMAAIALAAGVNEVLPFAVARSQTEAISRAKDAPYVATRADFTRRAFGTDADVGTGDSPFTTLASVWRPALAAGDSLIAPGAAGIRLVDDPTVDVAAPSIGTGLTRLAHAWAARNFALLSDAFRRRTRIVAVRDVRDRVAMLYPMFAVGPDTRPLFRADTLYWSVPLFTSSASYPLADRREVWGEGATYFHRAGTALVNARTGRVYAAIDLPPEPVAAAWIKKFETPRRMRDAQSVQHALSIRSAFAGGAGAEAAAGDTSFKSKVIRIYDSMRAALSAGDLRRFGLAYDSLGALVSTVKK